MYNEYFGFKESPFSIAPDPRYLYMTDQHRDALAHLVYGLNSEGGCILLTGEVGTGKTTICRCLLEQIPEQAKVALVFNPKVSAIELLETICDELKIAYPDSNNSEKTYTDRIYQYLIESNRKNEKTVLIIDEAQNLASDVLEQLRLLTNLETHQRKLLQIIILGQPELLNILARPEMRQLAQRITARFHLRPLTRSEVKAYVDHRLAIAGQNVRLFPEDSIKLLFRLSGGVPRLINVICDRALLGAYVENLYSVNTRTMKKAAKEVFGELKNVEQQQKNKRWLYPLLAVAGLASIVIGAVLFFNYTQKNISDATGSKFLSTTDTSDAATSATDTIITASEATANSVQQAGSDDINSIDQANTGNTDSVNNETTTTIEAENTGDKYDDITAILNSPTDNQVSAYQALFNTWGEAYNVTTGVTACKQAEKFSLSCLHKQGNLTNLKTHNRPAILALVNSRGNSRYITITMIDGESATVYSDNRKYKLKLSDVDNHWLGRFTLLWKKPASYSSAVSPGDRGNIVDWLNAQIAKINNDATEMIVSSYDRTLSDKIKNFQSQHGISPDGIVGPVTIIHLNTQTGMNVPLLIK